MTTSAAPSRRINRAPSTALSVLAAWLLVLSGGTAREAWAAGASTPELGERLGAVCQGESGWKGLGPRTGVGLMPPSSPATRKVQMCVFKQLKAAGCERVVPSKFVRHYSKKRRKKIQDEEDHAWVAKRLNLGLLVSAAPRPNKTSETLVTLRDRSGRVLETLRLTPSGVRDFCTADLSVDDGGDDETETDDATGDESEADGSENVADLAPLVKPSRRGSASTGRGASAALAARASSDEPVDDTSASGGSGGIGSGGGISSHFDRPQSVASTSGEQKMWAVAAGLKVMSRSVSYQDELAGGARTYRYSITAPALTLAAHATPAREAQRDWPVTVSVLAELEMLVGARMPSSAGPQSTQSVALLAGARASRALGSAVLSGQLAAGRDGLSVKAPVSLRAGPNVSYTFLEPGLGFDWQLSHKLRLGANVGYRGIFGAGEQASGMFLRKARIGGWTAGANAGWWLSNRFELQLDARFRSYSSVSQVSDETFHSGSAKDTAFRFGPQVTIRL